MRLTFGFSRDLLHRPRFVAALFAAICLGASPGAEAGQFGTRCQKDFQNGWQQPAPYMYARCSGFNDELDDTDTKLFYFNLKGTGSGFTFNDGSSSSGGVDSVDLLYVSTHGGADNFRAFFTLWAQSTFACSRFAASGPGCVSGPDWRVGDNSDQVAIFSQYACATLRIDDFAFGRWVNTFKGGMYLATGSHDKVADSLTTDEVGEDYADDLQDGRSVKWAWFDGNSDWDADQDVAVYASSSGALSKCQSRRDTMTWQNIGGFTRFLGGSMNRICASWISDN